LSEISIIDFLKFKASYGSQGNDALLTQARDAQNYHPWQDQYRIVNLNDNFSRELISKGNKDITWETSYNFNTGFDFSLFKNKLKGSAEYFTRQVDDMLYWLPVPVSMGISGGSIPQNLGSMINRGFEVDLAVNLFKNNDVSIDFGINATHFKNEILELPALYPDGYSDGRTWKEVGGSIYDLYYPVSAGTDSETGKALWRTYDPETGEYGTTDSYAVASEKDNQAIHGSSLPDLNGGFNLSALAYGFDFSIGFTYQLGGKSFDTAYRRLMHAGDPGMAGSNFHKDILNAWTPDNTTSDIPAVSTLANQNSSSDRFLTDATFLSLNNITVGYTFPKSLTQKLNVTSLRIFGVADNIKLWSKRQGFDPRQGYSGTTGYVYSPIRTISAGVKIGF